MKPKPSPIDVILGKNIRAARRARGVTLKALSAQLGFDYQNLQAYEMGRRRIGAAQIGEIARILDVPLANLYAGTIPRTTPMPPAYPHLSMAEMREILDLFATFEDRKSRRSLLSLLTTAVLHLKHRDSSPPAKP